MTALTEPQDRNCPTCGHAPCVCIEAECPVCRGTGWVEVITADVENGPEFDICGIEECDCPAGHAAWIRACEEEDAFWSRVKAGDPQELAVLDVGVMGGLA